MEPKILSPYKVVAKKGDVLFSTCTLTNRMKQYVVTRVFPAKTAYLKLVQVENKTTAELSSPSIPVSKDLRFDPDMGAYVTFTNSKDLEAENFETFALANPYLLKKWAYLRLRFFFNNEVDANLQYKHLGGYWLLSDADLHIIQGVVEQAIKRAK